MQRQAVESTNIKSAGYDPEDEVLEIEFHSGGVYHYVGVPVAVYEGMLAARSKGRYFGDFISNGQGDPLRKLGEELPATSPVHFRPAGVIL